MTQTEFLSMALSKKPKHLQPCSGNPSPVSRFAVSVSETERSASRGEKYKTDNSL